MQQALNKLWGFSSILFCRSSQALSGWKGTISPEMYVWVQVEALTEFSLSHSWVVLAVYVNSHSSLRTWMFWIRFSLRTFLYVAPALLSLPVPAAGNHPSARCCHHGASLLGRYWAEPGFLQTWRLWFAPTFKMCFYQTREPCVSQRDFKVFSLGRGFCLAPFSRRSFLIAMLCSRLQALTM